MIGTEVISQATDKVVLSAPVLNATSPVPFGSPIEFTFIDDPQWREAVYSITYTFDSVFYSDIFHTFNKTIAGSLKSSIVYGKAVHVWTIKATGYEDVVLTVVAQ